MAFRPFYENDVTHIAKLGEAGKLRDLNMTALHYEAASGRLFAHAETAAWAQAIAPYGLDNNKTGLTRDCASIQFGVLSADINTPESQEQLKQAVRTCIQVARAHGRSYYIVTDGASANALRELFGQAKIVY